MAIIFRTRGDSHFWALDAATGEAIGEPQVDICDAYRIVLRKGFKVSMRLSPPPAVRA